MVQSCSDDASALGFDDGSAPMMFLLSRSDDGSELGFDDGSALGFDEDGSMYLAPMKMALH